MKIKTTIYIGIVLLACASCTSPHAIIRTSEQLESIQLCTFYDTLVSQEFQQSIQNNLERFIIEYNASLPQIKVLGCDNSTEIETISFYFEPTDYVGKTENIAATFGNVLGTIVLPFAMISSGSEIYLAFYIWPDTRTVTHVEVSENLIGQMGKEWPFVLESPGYFNSMEKQNIKQGKTLYNVLKIWFDRIEKQAAREKESVINIKL